MHFNNWRDRAQRAAVLAFAGLTWILAPQRACAQPVEAFARLPLSTQMTLSPDGQRVASFLNLPDRTLLVTRAIEADEATPAMELKDKDLRFRWAHWVSNERLLVSMTAAARYRELGFQETRLVSIKFDGSGLVSLAKPPAGEEQKHLFQDRIVDWLPEDGHHVLLQLDSYYGPKVWKVNVDDGSKTVVQDAEDRMYGWMTDAQHHVRLGHWHSLDQHEIRLRDKDDGPWRTLWRYKLSELGFDEAQVITPLGFGLDPQELFILADHEGRKAIFSVRLDQPDLPRTLRLAHPTRDVSGSLFRSQTTGAILGVMSDLDDGEGGDQRGNQIWDPAWRTRMQAIDRALPRRVNTLTSISRDEQRYLVHSIGNGQPGEFFFVDRKAGQMALIGETYPDLSAAQLVGKRAVTIKARDGLMLHAYLTLPRGAAIDARLPTVLLPHGGPQSRDDTGFDVQTEFLASRGYAVLQVDFRGSAGYGRAFTEAGVKRWGLEMQDDLTDAVAWAVAQGTADPKRICIVGGSYGGYAALMGLAKTPQLYRCGVSFAGVTDLIGLIEDAEQYVGGAAALARQIGWAWKDRKQLRATSPVRLAEQIQAPLLLMHGTADLVVPVAQSRDMAKALKDAGKTFSYVEQDGGDHHLSRREDRLQFFQELEKFLAANLKP